MGQILALMLSFFVLSSGILSQIIKAENRSLPKASPFHDMLI